MFVETGALGPPKSFLFFWLQMACSDRSEGSEPRRLSGDAAACARHWPFYVAERAHVDDISTDPGFPAAFSSILGLRQNATLTGALSALTVPAQTPLPGDLAGRAEVHDKSRSRCSARLDGSGRSMARTNYGTVDLQPR